MTFPSRTKTTAHPNNSTSAIETHYTDTEFPWVEYTGTRTNATGPRNIWYVNDSKNGSKPTGPFPALKVAWLFVHGEKITAQPTNRPEITEVADIISPPTETSDQMIEFSCPHCGKAVIGLLARK
jgi:hypothetical protein